MDEQEKNILLSVRPHPEGPLKVLAYGVLALLVIFLGARTYREVREARGVIPQNTISISGKGSVFAKADIGHISFSVIREKPSAADAQKEAAEAAQKIVDFLSSKGIEEKDVKTSSYTVYPQYDYIEKRGQVLRGYQVNETFDVKVRNLDVVGDILSGATERGANQVGSLTLTIDDPDALMVQAREEAIKDAKSKADALAKDLGIKLGGIINYSESNGGVPVPMYYAKDAFGRGGAETQSVSPPISTGENEVIVNVSVVYAIK